MNIEPMLAEPIGTEAIELQLEALERLGRHVAEPKWDGHRAIVTIRGGRVVSIESRNGTSWLHKFPELVTPLAQAVNEPDVVLDGEVGYMQASGRKMDIGILQTRAETNLLYIQVHAKGYPMTYVAYDILSLNGELVVSQPFSARRELLEKVVTENERVKRAKTSTRLVATYREIVSLGGEGIMVKDTTMAYVPGERTRAWVKAKAPTYEDEYLVVGLLGGKNRRERLGTLILAKQTDEGLVYVCKAGSGLSEAEVDRILQAAPRLKRDTCPILDPPAPESGKPLLCWLNAGITADVKWEMPQETTKSRGRKVPRHPRILSVRVEARV